MLYSTLYKDRTLTLGTRYSGVEHVHAVQHAVQRQDQVQ